MATKGRTNVNKLRSGDRGDIILADDGTHTADAALMTDAELAASGGSALVGFLQAGTGATSRTAQAKLREVSFSVADFGVVGDSGADETTKIQAAIDAATAGSILDFGLGTYIYSTLTVNKALRFRGKGKFQTVLRTNSATANGIAVTTTAACVFEDMTLGATVVRTNGAYIYVNPASGYNTDSVFQRLNLQSPYLGINFVDASDFTIDDVYCSAYVISGVEVANGDTPDAGDSTITNSTFDGTGGTGIAIHQQSSGGLRITNNKFLGGAYHYLGEFNSSPNNTSILLFNDNSSENASSANVAISAAVGATTFGYVVVNGNQFAVGSAATGVLVADPGHAFFDTMAVGGNAFGLGVDSVGMSLQRGANISIFPNIFNGNSAGGNTAITFGANLASAICHRQDIAGVATRYAGTTTNVTFSYRYKKLSGTTGAVGASVSVAHGLTASKILSYDVLVLGAGGTVSMPDRAPGNVSAYIAAVGPTNLTVVTDAAGTDVASRPFTALITYEE